MAGGAGAAYEDDDGAGQGMIADINVTPLVDITLVLLIIMMVAAPLIANNPSVKVELPKAQTGDETPKTTLALTLRKDGQLFVGEAPVDEPGARARVRSARDGNPDVQAIVSADRGVDYGRVMRLIDLVKSEGVTRFALNVDGAL